MLFSNVCVSALWGGSATSNPHKHFSNRPTVPQAAGIAKRRAVMIGLRDHCDGQKRTADRAPPIHLPHLRPLPPSASYLLSDRSAFSPLYLLPPTSKKPTWSFHVTPPTAHRSPLSLVGCSPCRLAGHCVLPGTGQLRRAQLCLL